LGGLDLCSLKTVSLEEKRETAQQVDQFLDATFSHAHFAVRDGNTSDSFAFAFKAVVDSHFAGANIELRVAATINLPAFQVLARVDALPTLEQFDYKFRTKEALSPTPITTTFTNSTNGSLAMQAFVWKPTLYPKTGVWYLLLVADDSDRGLDNGKEAQLAVNVTLRTFACPARKEDGCSSHGKCGVTLTTNGKGYRLQLVSLQIRLRRRAV
jgi:hypothetical protein